MLNFKQNLFKDAKPFWCEKNLLRQLSSITQAIMCIVNINIFRNISPALLQHTVDHFKNYIWNHIWKEQLSSAVDLCAEFQVKVRVFFFCLVWSCGFEVSVDGILLISEFLGSGAEVKPLEEGEEGGKDCQNVMEICGWVLCSCEAAWWMHVGA